MLLVCNLYVVVYYSYVVETTKRKQSQDRPKKDKRPAKAQKKSVEKERNQAIVIATYSPAGPSTSSDAEPEPEPERPAPAPSTPATPQHQQPYRRLSFSPRYSTISPCSSLCSLICQPSISTLDATYSHHSSSLLRGPAPTAPYQTPTPVISTPTSTVTLPTPDPATVITPSPDQLASRLPMNREASTNLKIISTSHCNFAVNLLRKYFMTDDLINKNIAGVRGKGKVDPERISQIMATVYDYYPTPPAQKEAVWRECRKFNPIRLGDADVTSFTEVKTPKPRM
ncbi:hypothetical protein AC249_AIPGENE9447 [Exaiptasia diaphana]|nr:hypothetical protein AC249_AIPGENE9447 [Exaiptasia diaphana]